MAAAQRMERFKDLYAIGHNGSIHPVQHTVNERHGSFVHGECNA